MGAFGDRLRREREMRGITLDEIAESTKISRRHLQALEKDQFDQLPGGVFNKGFVRAYARFLGIDEDQAVSDYSTASNEQPEPEDKFPLEIHDEPDRDLNPRRSVVPLAFAGAALVGILVGYMFWAKSKPHASEATEARPQQAVTASPSPAAPKPDSTQIPGTQTTPAANSKPIAEQPTATTSAKPEKQASPVVQEKKPLEKAFVVMVKAKEDSWVSVVADGKSVMQRVLPADKQKLIKAEKQIILRTGNAGGIDVTFNGKSLGALGNENEPRTLTFNAAGLVQ